MMKNILILCMAAFSMVGAPGSKSTASKPVVQRNEFHYQSRTFCTFDEDENTSIYEVTGGKKGRRVVFEYRFNKNFNKRYELKITDNGKLNLERPEQFRPGFNIAMSYVVNEIFDAWSLRANGRELVHNGKKLTLKFDDSSSCVVEVETIIAPNSPPL